MNNQQHKAKAQKFVADQLAEIALGIADGRFNILTATFQNNHVMQKNPLDLREPVKCVPGPDTIVFLHLRDTSWFKPTIVGPEGN